MNRAGTGLHNARGQKSLRSLRINAERTHPPTPDTKPEGSSRGQGYRAVVVYPSLVQACANAPTSTAHQMRERYILLALALCALRFCVGTNWYTILMVVLPKRAKRKDRKEGKEKKGGRPLSGSIFSLSSLSKSSRLLDLG